MSAAPVPIFVISLARATARRAQVENEFAKIGFDYALFDGVDGQACEAELRKRTDEVAWRRNMGAPLSLGHLGCYASHVELWRQIGVGQDEIVLICEDDVTFTPDFPNALQTALELADRWDIVRFSRIRAKGPLKQVERGSFTLNAYWGPFTGNGCYLIKRSVAARLADSFYPITRAHDHELNRFFKHDIRLMGLEPFTAPPRDQGESFITGTAMADAKKFPKHKRLAYYWQKIANYGKRLHWLARQGLFSVLGS
ncbi:glycosyl transferase family 25 [Rhodobacter aestuarii]|uniref:Glycosyl transferase, family 25 n=1 Tax=Rhodobacter aestuarii TaxID=453582 RepID=A0A1N7Q9Q3_9RHOB|nr:glycosyltransferase family 25 protein [Rhodobacter aestuarii]PTV93788.1 glycosyl transferase family 25 [Rhodobacter aestuarii]SIT19554.1 glycosyl transferase, family 25 [Rhodobacter aestuarii]